MGRTIYKIKDITLLNEDKVEDREVQVTLTNGTIVHIVACMESWEQYGGNTDELYSTMHVAETCNDWLHGGENPYNEESLPF